MIQNPGFLANHVSNIASCTTLNFSLHNKYKIIHLVMRICVNHFTPNQLSTPNFSLHNKYKIRHLVMRKWELIKQSKLQKTKIEFLSNAFNKKYGFKVTVQFKRCFWLVEHISVNLQRNPINLYITEQLIKFSKWLFNFYLVISNK